MSTLTKLSTLLLSASLISGLKIHSVIVPKVVKSGDTAELRCQFDLEGAALYSLTWWKGSHQFYQYSGDGREPPQIYNEKGIQVDRERSTQNVVVLTNVSMSSGGRYKCEVLTEQPNFEKEAQFATMDVVEEPVGNPNIRLRKHHWRIGEKFVAQCSSKGGNPFPKLVWYINGNKVDDFYSKAVKPNMRSTVNNRNWDSQRKPFEGQGTYYFDRNSVDDASTNLFQKHNHHFYYDPQLGHPPPREYNEEEDQEVGKYLLNYDRSRPKRNTRSSVGLLEFSRKMNAIKRSKRNSLYETTREPFVDPSSDDNVQTVELHLVLNKKHFRHPGVAQLSCSAEHNNIYAKKSNVRIALPGIPTSSPSHRISQCATNSLGVPVITSLMIGWLLLGF